MAELPAGIEISNARALTDVFGYWPSFHNAQLRSLMLERDGSDAPYLEARLHVSEMTATVDAQGQYGARQHRLVVMRFVRVASLELSGFAAKNVLGLLSIAPGEPDASDARRWAVRLVGAAGCSADFGCDAVVVRAVESLDPV